MNDLNQALEAELRAMEERLAGAVTRAAQRTFRRLCERSPVDSGAYLANHQLGAEDHGRVDQVRFSGGSPEERRQQAMAHALAKAEAYRFRPGDRQVILTNTLDYAPAVEHGTSRQAPAGVYALAEAEFDALLAEELDKAGLL